RRGPVFVNRPVFEGFNVGATTDYTFLNPELLAALFLLRQDNPPRTRSFVLKTVDRVQAAVPEQRGFIGQVGMEATVDQLWAIRLLTTFRALYQDKTRRHMLRPSLAITNRRLALLALTAGFVVGLVITLITDSATGGFVAGALFGLALIPLSQR